MEIALMEPAAGAELFGVGETGILAVIRVVTNVFEGATGSRFDRLPRAI
jgi:CO/xanthine dehydrogenase Mo-binding subunit